MHLPQIKILAGIWGAAGDLEKAKERFGSARPDRVVTTLAQAVEQIGEWRKASLAELGNVPAVESGRSEA
jgi:hypothetical protein